MSTGEAERQQAGSKYAEHSKTGWPRRSRKVHDQVSPSRHTENAPAPMSQQAPSIPRLRRPHTSAGPRDKLGNLSGIPYTLPRNFFGPEASRGPPSPVFWKRRKDVHSVQKPVNDSSSMLTLLRSRISVNSTCSSFDTDSDAVREWEQELARIEIRSRRSSELIGFPWKRRRSAAVLPEK